MKIIRKKRQGIKIKHNSKLFWIIILLIIALIILIYFIIQKNPKQATDIEKKNCVPATCCHPDECVLAEQAPNCKNTICSMVCSGPLDCNAGHCEFINNKCTVIPNE
jgi:hypothetical protein